MNSARETKGLLICTALTIFVVGAAAYERLEEVAAAADDAQSTADEAQSKADEVDGRADELEGRVESACEAHNC